MTRPTSAELAKKLGTTGVNETKLLRMLGILTVDNIFFSGDGAGGGVCE